MKAFRQVVAEVLILGVAAVVVAFTVNAARTKGSLRLARNYVDDRIDQARDARALSEAAARDRAAAAGASSASTSPTSLAGTVAEPATSSAPAPSGSDGHLEHPYQSISLAEVVEVFNDPNTATGANVFVDARNDDTYAEGHIPGALQANHYEIERYIDDVMQIAVGAEKVIVYCNGGDCEDSIFVCGDLLEAGLSWDSIYLFEGGWTAWTARNMPVATGGGE
ncbi:MAG: rhodanese-like domain-containing protein [Phycisphaerae bacterium]